MLRDLWSESFFYTNCGWGYSFKRVYKLSSYSSCRRVICLSILKLLILGIFCLENKSKVFESLSSLNMRSFLFIVGLVRFMIALLSLAFRYKHLLSVLLRLEAITIRLFVLLFSLHSSSITGERALIFIALGACEARLGLRVLVSIIRAQGNDYVSRFSSQKC